MRRRSGRALRPHRTEGRQIGASGWRLRACRVAIRSLWALFPGVGLVGPAGVQANDVRPNLVFLFTDDQRWDALGCMGNDVIQTPNLDRLATRGTLFESAFVTTSICAVSRACVLSGQYASRHGIQDFFTTFTPSQLAQTYPALLRDAGYFTGFIGKWGIGDSVEATARGAAIFEFWAGASHQTNYWHQRDCRYVRHDGRGEPPTNTCDCPPDARGVAGPGVRIGKANLQDPLHLTTEIVPGKMRAFLTARDPDRPFCLSVFFKAPHSPFSDFSEGAADRYRGQAMPVPETATPEDRDRLPWFLDGKLGRSQGERWIRRPETLQAHTRDYYRLISDVDAAVGELVRALAEAGEAENTVILMTSDNGHFKGEFGLAGKWLMYEPSMRVPAFVFDPRRAEASRGQRREELVQQIDFAATLLDLAGVSIPATMQGRSLVPLLDDAKTDWREDVFYEHAYHHRGQIEPSEGVRGRRWKYIRYGAQDPVVEQLFDLEQDPLERFDLAARDEHREDLERLRARWAHYAASVGVRYREAELAGSIEHPAVREASGMAVSRALPDALWVANDSGNDPVLYAINDRGEMIADVGVADVGNRDWEDLAAFRLDGVPYLLIADVGDNVARRTTCDLVVIRDPLLDRSPGLLPDAVSPAWTVTYRYPDGPRDCEAVAVDADRNQVLLLSKRNDPPELYTVPLRPDSVDVVVAERVGEAPSIPPPTAGDLLQPYGRFRSQPTGMDFLNAGRDLVVLTYKDAYLYRRADRENWSEVMARPPSVIRLPHPDTGVLPIREAVAVDPATGAIYVTSERSPAPLYRLDPGG